jgi:hypothetical protein
MSHASAIATMQGLTRLGFIKMIRALKFVNVLDFIGMGQECYKKYKWVTTYADLVQQEFLHQNSARMLADAEAAADQYMNSLGGHEVFPYDPELKDFAGFHETPEDRDHYNLLVSLIESEGNPEPNPAKPRRFRRLLPPGRKPYSAQRTVTFDDLNIDLKNGIDPQETKILAKRLFQLTKQATEIQKRKKQEWLEDHRWEDIDISDGISFDEGLAILNHVSWARKVLDGISITDVIDFAEWSIEKIGQIDVSDSKVDLTDGVSTQEVMTLAKTMLVHGAQHIEKVKEGLDGEDVMEYTEIFVNQN